MRYDHFLSVSLVQIGFWLCAASADQPRSTDSSSEQFYVGVCAHFGQHKGIPPLNLKRMQAAGIDSLRDELGWSGVERSRGQYQVSDRQTRTFRQAAEMGLQPMLILDYANPLYDDGDRPRSDEALEGYARYGEFLVQHFGSAVSLYEVWNEYDIAIGMPQEYRKGGSAEDYVKMLRFVYPRLKAVDAEITVMGGAPTSGGVRNGWLEKVVQLGGLQHCDLLSIHTYNYSERGAARTPEAWYGVDVGSATDVAAVQPRAGRAAVRYGNGLAHARGKAEQHDARAIGLVSW